MAAEQGHAEAQNGLGIAAHRGRGRREGRRSSDALVSHGCRAGPRRRPVQPRRELRHAAGVPRDAGEAVRWYRMAAAQGNFEAQFNLAVKYKTGDGVPEDAAEAAIWYRAAAEQGFAAAQFNLGVAYGCATFGGT